VATLPDLSDVVARLAWARDHASRVKDLSRAWSERAVTTSTTPDPATGEMVFRAEVASQPGTEIALALSDTLHQARATLDCLVGVLRGGATRASAFLVTRDPAVFDADERGRLAGVPPWAVAAIREVQPFVDTPWRHVGEWLDHLHQLAIDDRHHALLLRSGLIDLGQAWAATTHGGQTRFGMDEGGRVLTLRYPAEAVVSPRVKAEAFVAEARLRWRDRDYPPFPAAPVVADQVVWAADHTIQLLRHFASRSDDEPTPAP
jgi:hypothetical protein